MKKIYLFLGFVLLVSLSFVLAQSEQQSGQMPLGGEGEQQSGPGQGPPEEAIDACSGMSEGDTCSFSGGQGEDVSGTCGSGPDGQFACGPEGGDQQREQEQPRQEASGDQGQPEQTQQSQQFSEEEIGLIRKLLSFFFGWMSSDSSDDGQDKALGQEKDPDQQGPPQEAIDACSDKSEGDSCSFTGGQGETVADTCNSDSGQLACGRPPEGQQQGDQKSSGNTGTVISTVTDVIATTETSVDAGQIKCYSASGEMICPDEGESFYGQDAQYSGLQMTYIDNGDETVTDVNTGLMWQQNPGEKQGYYDFLNAADDFELASYDDWRVPTTKELYSLIDFSGEDISVESTSADTPFIDDSIFGFEYGDISAGERIIDSQWMTSNIYVSKVMGNSECFFGLNFADGRIKCYGTSGGLSDGQYYGIYVRGDSYGINDFADNNDETITDNLNGLMWQKQDSGKGLNWEDALAHCEDLSLASYNDWRLPNVKELQLLVDYTRSPDTTSSAALDPIFEISEMTNEAGQADYVWHWSSTTHAGMAGGSQASYVAFGRSMGYMDNQWMDVHGAGSQRSDPKSGDPDDYPEGRGPQGDAIRIYNYVRCVRG